MARKFVVGIDLLQNELINARVVNLGTAPSTPVEGQIYFNNTAGNKILYFYNGTEWIPASGSLEVIQDAINTTFVAGTGLDKTYDDNAGTFTLDIDSTVTTLTGSQTLTNKTLTSPVLGGTTTTASGNLVVKPATSILEVQGDGASVVGQIQLNCHVNSHGQKIASQPHSQNATNTLKLPGGTTIGNADATLVSDTGTQTLTNKTLTSPTISNPVITGVIGSAGLVFEGATADDHETTLAITEPTTDRSITFPDNSGTVILSTNTVNSLTAPSAAFSMNSNKITNLATPTDASDAVTKAYVDATATGLDVKASVRVSTTANVNLTNASEIANGRTIDGITLVTGDRVLVKHQTTASENGIYIANDAVAPTRATDANSDAEVTAGLFAFVEQGTLYGNTGWVLTSDNPITLGTTSLLFSQFSGVGTFTAGAGITLSGTEFSVDVTPTSGNASLTNTGGAVEVKVKTADGLEVTADGLGINNGTGLVFDAGAITLDTASGYGVRKKAFSIGDGTAVTYAVTHNLATKDVTVHVYRVASPFDQIESDVEHTDTNNITIGFAAAPSANQYRVVIVG